MGSCRLCGRFGWLMLAAPERFRVPLVLPAHGDISACRGIRLGLAAVMHASPAEPGAGGYLGGMPRQRPWLTLGRAGNVPAHYDLGDRPAVSLLPLVSPADDLTIEEVRRYSRHLIIPDVGKIGQRRLKNAKVLCVGAGGLGSPALMYLAAAGVGTLGIVDFDVVDESNLQRQIIHGTSDVGKSKAVSAKETINRSTRSSP